MFQGVPYSFGPTNAGNAITSVTVPLPVGSYSNLNFLGAAMFGNQASPIFTVTYTDDSATTSRKASATGSPQNYPGESIASTMAYRVSPNGPQQTYALELFGYSLPLNTAKTVKSFTASATLILWCSP